MKKQVYGILNHNRELMGIVSTREQAESELNNEPNAAYIIRGVDNILDSRGCDMTRAQIKAVADYDREQQTWKFKFKLLSIP